MLVLVRSVFLVGLVLTAATVAAQSPAPSDSLRQTLGAAEVSATRAAALDPVPFTEVLAPRSQAAYSGQELPVFLQRTPNVISNAEAGTPFGYTNFRLRGIDQTRLNVTLDGVPLNEPEDQGAYFVNFPGFADFTESVQIQRGTGLTPNGTAPLGGSLNFLTTKPDASDSHLQGSLTGGAFGTGRGSFGYRTGPTKTGFAALVRGTYQRTDGYRRDAFHRGGSGIGALSWTGQRTVVRLLLLAGDARNGASYVASSDSAIARDQRDNPLSPEEKDHFRQQLAALTVSQATGARGVWTTTLYGTRLRGAYDVRLAADSVPTFALASGWGGVISTWQYTGARLDFTTGVHALRYARRHTLTADGAEQYRNTGHWNSETAFAKATWRFGADPQRGLRAFADVGVRHAGFRYAPDGAAGLTSDPQLAWTFLNPKVGLTWARAQFSVFASVGRTRREPTRNDLFAGADNLTAPVLASLGSLERVKPEQVTDFEAGLRLTRPNLSASLTGFAMEFRNEIAATGQLSDIGLPLRRNVGESYRRGVELEATVAPTHWLYVLANAAYTAARIREYPDDAVGQTYRNVRPLLTPALTGYVGPRVIMGRFTLLADVQMRSRAYLSNANDARFRLPAAAQLDAGIRYAPGHFGITYMFYNLTDTPYAAGGFTDGVRPYYFVLAPPNMFITLTYNR
jgi:iron complex outermembrane recepter protein